MGKDARMTIQIEQATRADLPAIGALLEQFDLPCDGLAERLPTTLVTHADGRVVGTAALELFGDVALLRSVAVDATLRGQGIGQQLTEAALGLARAQRIPDVYLLTETAATFFPRFGFQPIGRAEVAPTVQQSVEFVSACPASALVMVRSLAPA
jgi:amino-acid N-acetyltransferase